MYECGSLKAALFNRNICQEVKIRYTIMFNYVYVLESINNGNLYIGCTDDLNRRLLEHNRGLNFSTKPHIPWKILHYEAYLQDSDANRRDKYLKSNQGSRLLKLMLKDYFYEKKSKSF